MFLIQILKIYIHSVQCNKKYTENNVTEFTLLGLRIYLILLIQCALIMLNVKALKINIILLQMHIDR